MKGRSLPWVRSRLSIESLISAVLKNLDGVLMIGGGVFALLMQIRAWVAAAMSGLFEGELPSIDSPASQRESESGSLRE